MVLISGLLRLRLINFLGSVPLNALRASSSSNSRGDSKIVTGWCTSGLVHCVCIDSSAVSRVGSIGTRGKVWLRGRLMLLHADGRRDWLVGVKGLSETMVEVGLTMPAEEEVSSEVVLLE